MIKIINRIPALPYKPREVDEPLEDIHRAKVYSLLKPWHPFFRFEVLRENKSGSIDFRISLNKAFNSKHSLIGCFYWPGRVCVCVVPDPSSPAAFLTAWL